MKKILIALLAGCVLALSGCAPRPPDPGASRTVAQADHLRNRMAETQIDR